MLIRETTLSVRAINALTKAGYETVEGCQNLSEEKLLSLQNLGKKTLSEILQFQEHLKKFPIEAPPPINPKERFDYLATVLAISLTDLSLSERGANVLKSLRVKLLRDLVVLRPEDIFVQKNSGKKTVADLTLLLKKLDLAFCMTLDRDLKIEIKRRTKIFKDSESAIKRFLVKYPNKASVLEDLKIDVLSKNKVLFYKQCFELYKEGGTLEYVGSKIGKTRERVRQILEKGNKYKLFEYVGHNYVYISKEKLIKDIIKYRSLQKVSQKNEVSVSYLNRLLVSYGLTKSKIEKLMLIGLKELLKDKYFKIKEELGHDPTSTELQSRDDWRTLEGRIRRAWTSIHEFRKELDIPSPPPFKENVRPWLEHRMRIALIKRMQDLDTVREILSASGSLQTGEISAKARVDYARAYKLVQLLIATGEVVREGIGSATSYRISNEREKSNEDNCENTTTN